MKFRYYVFAHGYDACGGMEDVVIKTNKLEKAIAFAHGRSEPVVHIHDFMTDEEIEIPPKEKEPTPKLRPYEDFKNDYLKLCDHTLAKPEDEIRLRVFVDFDYESQCKEILSSQNLCGTPACIAGNLPEVFPDRFEYTQRMGVCIEHKEMKTHISQAMVALPGQNKDEVDEEFDNILEVVDYDTHLTFFDFIFDSNRYRHSDREEVERRRELVANATTYYEMVRNFLS